MNRILILLICCVGVQDFLFAQATNKIGSVAYELRSLSSLENFIKQDKHLPEVPSAKEVEAQGISVGDSQALLLKKIEESTLYIIDQQKQILEMKKEIQKTTTGKQKL
jgi:hypothetical protein